MKILYPPFCSVYWPHCHMAYSCWRSAVELEVLLQNGGSRHGGGAGYGAWGMAANICQNERYDVARSGGLFLAP